MEKRQASEFEMLAQMREAFVLQRENGGEEVYLIKVIYDLSFFY